MISRHQYIANTKGQSMVSVQTSVLQLLDGASNKITLVGQRSKMIKISGRPEIGATQVD